MKRAGFALDLVTGQSLTLAEVMERIGLSYGDVDTLAEIEVIDADRD